MAWTLCWILPLFLALEPRTADAFRGEQQFLVRGGALSERAKERCGAKKEGGRGLFGSHSCRSSWRSGRCAWLGGRAKACVPNCVHAKNQEKDLCEPNFCDWSEADKSCSFSETGLAARQGFCEALPKELNNAQKGFCTGLATALLPPLTAMERPIDLDRFTGCWYVIAHIPTFVDRGRMNGVQRYDWDAQKELMLVTYSSETESGKKKLLYQKASIKNEAQTNWAITPKVVSLLPYLFSHLIIDCAEDYSTTMIGQPDRSYLWIMARTPRISEATMRALVDKAVGLGYDAGKIRQVPQTWTKRGILPEICPE